MQFSALGFLAKVTYDTYKEGGTMDMIHQENAQNKKLISLLAKVSESEKRALESGKGVEESARLARESFKLAQESGKGFDESARRARMSGEAAERSLRSLNESIAEARQYIEASNRGGGKR